MEPSRKRDREGDEESVAPPAKQGCNLEPVGRTVALAHTYVATALETANAGACWDSVTLLEDCARNLGIAVPAPPDGTMDADYYRSATRALVAAIGAETAHEKQRAAWYSLHYVSCEAAELLGLISVPLPREHVVACVVDATVGLRAVMAAMAHACRDDEATFTTFLMQLGYITDAHNAVHAMQRHVASMRPYVQYMAWREIHAFLMGHTPPDDRVAFPPRLSL
jgi:hypothetical protein